ncbi:MAG: DUF4062 domain-containing protein [Lactococcus lactis]
MEKKYQVFVSSTYTDLIDERQKVVEAILNAGHIPAGMELFKAGPKQEIIIREWIEASDIYVLILGPRYGSMNEQESISYTQWEYNLAKELDKPMFSLVLTDDYIQKMVDDKRIPVKDLETSNPLYKKFKGEVMDSLVEQINHPAEIRSAISDSIQDIERRYPGKLEGWIKGSNLNELEKLVKENKKLSSELVTRQRELIKFQEKAKPVKDEYIGQFKFSVVKQLLSADLPDLDKLEELKKEIEQKLKVSKNSDFIKEYEEELRFIETIVKLNYSGLDMLMHVNSQLATSGFSPGNTDGQRYFKNFYFSKWMELSIIELKKGNKVNRQTYILSSAGKKFVSMIKMEKLN